MVMKKVFLFLSIFCFQERLLYGGTYDVNLIGYLMDVRSVSRHTSSFVDCLQDHCSLKLFKSRKCDKKFLSEVHQKLIDSSINLKNHKKLRELIEGGLEISGMTIYTQSLWAHGGIYNAWKEYSMIPNSSILQYAYVVAEYTKIPKNEVKIFNQNFDALIIPDPWLENIYRGSGVTIPIFTLPLVLDLASLHARPAKTKKPVPFVFGFTGVDAHRKNVRLLIEAFAQEFGNDSNVSLIVHSRLEDGLGAIDKMITKKQCTNIKFISKSFSREEYEDFISALSCYVILSKAEGFSITPREALAARVPCILSNNTAHKIICDTGFVAAVKSDIPEPFYTRSKQSKGCMFNCKVSDARKMLRDMYKRYAHYVDLAEKGQEWTKQYLVENLKSKYVNLVKPSRVILGKENKISDKYLMVNSRKLFNKYRLLCADCDTVFVE